MELIGIILLICFFFACFLMILSTDSNNIVDVNKLENAIKKEFTKQKR